MTPEQTARRIDAIEKWLRVFHPPGDVVELRALNVAGKRAVCETFDDLRALAVRAVELDAAGATGCYFTPNPLRPELAGWKDSRIKAADVLFRRWLLIDCDSDKTRPPGTNATDDEKEAGWRVLDRCKGLLDTAGLTGGVIGDSGNGWHLNYPIEAANDEASQQLIKEVLKGLHERCGDEMAGVTISTHDAPRIWKLYGTMARKGPHSDERPHRDAMLIEPAEAWEHARAAANWLALGKLPAKWQAQQDMHRNKPDGITVAERARAYIAKMPDAVSGQGGHDATWDVAQVLARGFALSRSDSWPILCEYNASRCTPPWSEKELAHKIETAERDSRLPLGYLASKNGGPAPVLPPLPDPPPEGSRIIQRASEIEPKEVIWLWPGRIPLAKLTTFAGQSSQGKTFVACDIAARISRGDYWPDGKPGVETPGQVLFITGDDDIDDTLVPRMAEAGAALERIVFLTEPAQAAWTMAALKTLDTAIAQADGNVQLVVIDPPTSFLHGIDDHKNAELRSILTPFKDWAQRQRCAVIMVTHVNKAGGQQVDAMMRVMGSIAWVSSVRTAYMFAADPDCQDRQLFLTLKNNLGPKARSLAYRIVSGVKNGRIEWLGEVDTTADEAVTRPRNKQGPRCRVATEWLVDRFREQREWESSALFARGKSEGVSRDAIFEAKRILELPKPRRTVGQDGSVTWMWWVPLNWSQFSSSENGSPLATVEVNPLPD